MSRYAPGRLFGKTVWRSTEVLDYATSVELGILPYDVVVSATSYTPTVFSPSLGPTTGVAADTLYGGSTILCFAGSDLVSRTEHSLTLLTAPSAWTAVTGGTTATAYQATGMQLQVGPGSGSSLRFGPTSAMWHGDLTVEFQPQTPVSTTLATEVVLAGLELTAGSTVALLALVRDTSTCFLRLTITGYPERRIQIGIDAASLRNTWSTLRVQRFGAFLQVFDLTGSVVFSQPVYDASTTLTARLLVQNQTSGTAQTVSTLFRNWSVIGGVAIDNRIAVDVEQATLQHLRAVVPAAVSPFRIGRRDLSVFGPYGAGTLTNGFEYTYPPERRLISGTPALFSAADPSVRVASLARWKPKVV